MDKLQQKTSPTFPLSRGSGVLKRLWSGTSPPTLRLWRAGRYLCGTLTDSANQLLPELQELQESWRHSSSLLEDMRARISSTCQSDIAAIRCELDRLRAQLCERTEPEEEEHIIQRTVLSLQHLAAGLRDLDTMKTDLSPYIVAGDSALLEQQLEQLHSLWDELCMKVSSRRQEIADRLNAWTIFSDKNKELCDWLTQMEDKVHHHRDLSIEELVEKLKKGRI
ncbi:unnamed protein product [Lampetra planeri]